MSASFGAKSYRAAELFSERFHPWCETHDPMAAKTWSAAKLGTELARLADMPLWQGKITIKRAQNANRYSFPETANNAAVIKLRAALQTANPTLTSGAADEQRKAS